MHVYIDFYVRHEITATLFPTKCPAAIFSITLFTTPQTIHKMRKERKKSVLLLVCVCVCFFDIVFYACFRTAWFQIFMFRSCFVYHQLVCPFDFILVNLTWKVCYYDVWFWLSTMTTTTTTCTISMCRCIDAVAACTMLLFISHNNFIRDRVKFISFSLKRVCFFFCSEKSVKHLMAAC